MGPSLARLAVNAIRQAGLNKKVIGVSRFSNKELRRELEEAGVEIISADLSDDKTLQALPETQNILYMAGNKFGTTGNEHFTWMMNAYLPGRVAERFRNSRMVVFSTGNVYPLLRSAKEAQRKELLRTRTGSMGNPVWAGSVYLNISLIKMERRRSFIG